MLRKHTRTNRIKGWQFTAVRNLYNPTCGMLCKTYKYNRIPCWLFSAVRDLHNPTCSIHAKHGRVRSTLQRHMLPENLKISWFVMTYGPEIIPAHSDGSKPVAGRQNKLSMHINDDVLEAAMDLWLAYHHHKLRNAAFESLVRYFSILECLLILSELNVQYINKSVCEFESRFIRLRMTIKKE